MTTPGDAKLLENALSLLRDNRLAEAERLLRRLLQAEPNHPIALHQLGLLAHHLGHLVSACDYISRATAADPRSSPMRSDLAVVLELLGRRDEAVAALGVASELEPRNVAYLGRLALSLESLGRFDESRECYRRAEPLVHNDPDALSGGAGALGRMGYIEDAMRFCKRALELNPRHAGANNNLGQAHALLADVDGAIAAFRAAIANGLTEAWDNLLFHIHFHPAYDAAAIYAEHRRWTDSRVDPPAPAGVFARVNRDPGRRLRVGYVSPDFRVHPVSRLFEPVLANHDRAQVEVVCYSTGTQVDAMTGVIRSHAAAAWRDAAGADDATLTEQMRRDGIDVLVDLSLHMDGNRLGVFARRAAPVQVTWLGYPSTSGLEQMDYRLSDPHLDPPTDDGAAVYSERTVRLPHSFWPYRPPAGGPQVNDLPALIRGHVTFASFNNPAKFNLAVYDAFARVLASVEGSRLLLLNNGGPAAARRVVDLLEARGVSGERVEVLDRAPLQTYLEYHHRADIVLDPFPYPGHTTTLDALWMGVPVVTLAGGSGASAASRGGKSILTNVGLIELIAHDVNGYVATACELARDLDRLAGLRATLRQRLEHSPIGDLVTFTRGIERAYRSMWTTWCAT